jgi:hypothetical protein
VPSRPTGYYTKEHFGTWSNLERVGIDRDDMMAVVAQGAGRGIEGLMQEAKENPRSKAAILEDFP